MHPHSESDRSFTHRVLIVIGLVGLIGLLAITVYFTIDVILLIFSAALLAIFLRGLATPVGKYLKLNDTWSVLLVAAILIAILAGSITLLAPSVAEQAKHLREELPKSAQQAAAFIGQYSWGQAIIAQFPNTQEIMAKIDTGSVLSGVGGFFSTTIGAIGNFLIVILLAIYFASEPRLYSDGLSKLFPKPKRARAREFLRRSATHELVVDREGGFDGGHRILTWIGLSILGVPMARTLGC